MAPAPIDMCRLDIERRMLLRSAAPSMPACDQLAPRFPFLALFVRLLVTRHPEMADAVGEQLSQYSMGWHCHAHDAPRDMPIDFVEFAADALDCDMDGGNGRDLLYDFERQFMLFYLDEPALLARHMHREDAVMLDI